MSNQKKSKSETIPLIYIGGYGHSGSTIFEILLCCNPKIKGLGELFRFGEALDSSYTKKLLSERNECSLMFSRIKEALKLQEESLESYKEVSHCEKIGSFEEKNLNRYKRLWATFFQAVQNGDTNIMIVDSSKSSFAHLKRFKLLQSMQEVDATMIHIIRHPRPILIRLLNHLKKKSSKISSTKKLFYLLKYSLSWLFSNIWPIISTNNDKYVRICFEELCQYPEKTLKKVENDTDLDLSKSIQAIKNNETLPKTCAITGNMRVRKNQDLKFQPSKKSIPKSDVITIVVSWIVVPFYYLLK